MTNFANPQEDTNALRVVLASGSILLPSVVFANDLTKGLYWDINGLHLTGLATPTNTGDAANKAYVDANSGAPLASPTFTGTVTIPTPFVLGATSVTATGAQMNFLVGATSAIQTQLNAKQATVSVVDASATVGGAATESVTVAGLLTTSTIWAVTQKTVGGANLPLEGWTNTTNGHLNIIYSADMGVGAVVRVVFIP